MDAPYANFPREVQPSKNENPFDLDKNIAHLISGYLTSRDLLNLCLASKGIHGIFYPSLEKRLMSYFLKYVAKKRLDKVEEILNRNKKLVFLSRDITDLSGREFKRITAFQYATWSLDKEMWELILRYLPETDAYEQLRVFEHERHDITKVHGTRLNFAPLLEAYQKYIDNYEPWTVAQYEACWCKEVGRAQRQMPAWFVYLFCQEREEKVWSKGGCNWNFRRDPKDLRWWFDQEWNGGKLGDTFGVTRGGDAVGSGVERATFLFGRASVLAQRSTTSQFMEGRTSELLGLAERLSQMCGENKKFPSHIK